MRNSRVRSALGLWRASHARSASDRRYAAYLGAMLSVAFVAPTARALWISASQPEVLRALATPNAPLVGGLCAAGLWIAALLAGRLRGPALRPPLLTHVFARSEHSRVSAFGGSIVRAGAVVTAVTSVVSAGIGGLLGVQAALPFDSALAIAALGAGIGVCVGVIATVLWLAGQALPRLAGALAIGLTMLVGLTIALPASARFTPWGWTAALWNGAGIAVAGSSHAAPWPAPVALLCALTVVLVSSTPALFARLDSRVLEAQATRWESSSLHASGMDFSSALAAYQGRPWAGRRVRAVRTSAQGRRGLALTRTFVIRDAVGAARAPGRLAAGALGITAASVLVTLASSAPQPGVGLGVLGAFGAVVAFAALGPFTDGVRHAAAVAADLPVYGVSDAHVLVLHSVFPVVAALLIAGITASASATLIGVAPLAPVLCSAAVAVCAVFARVGNALKGPLPVRLLTPIPTPEGDLSGAVRFLWSIDGIVLVALIGATMPLAAAAPAWCAAPCAALLAVGAARWRRRRTGAG